LYTNTTPVSPYRGCGRPHACFVIERALDRLARELGIDRAEIRRRNFIQPNDFPYRRGDMPFADGAAYVLDSGDYERQLDLLLAAIGYDNFPEEQANARKEGRYLGLGLACSVEATAPGPYEGALVQVQAASGKIVVATGLSSQGQSHETTFAQIAAEELGVAATDVIVETGDTAIFGWGTGTFGSRAAVTGGTAVALAARRLREKALRLAGEILEIAPDDLDFKDGRVFVREAPDRGITLLELAIVANPLRYAFDEEFQGATQFAPSAPREGPQLRPGEEPGLEATSYFSPPQMTWGSGSHAAVIEVDIETGEVHYLRYFVAHDCGRMINPMVVEGQIVGGVAQGIGGSLYERMAYDRTGQLRNASFMDFLMPYATEVPSITILHHETPSPLNPLGIKGVGEAGVIPVAAVTASAIDNALASCNVEVRRMPLVPEQLLDLISQ
jgi:carbon-monoxide dehydrogenase large subunit